MFRPLTGRFAPDSGRYAPVSGHFALTFKLRNALLSYWFFSLADTLFNKRRRRTSKRQNVLSQAKYVIYNDLYIIFKIS